MGIPLPDIAFPVGNGNNRPEHFLIEYDGILRSDIEILFYGLLLLPEYEPLFPKLYAMECIDPNEFYHDYSLYTKREFLEQMAEGTSTIVTDELVDDLMDQAAKCDTYGCQSSPILLLGLKQLAAAEYVKEIHIVNKRGLQSYEMDYLSTLLGEHLDKIHFFKGDLKQMIEDKGPYTTIFLNSIQDVYELAQDISKYHLYSTVFVVRQMVQNCTHMEEWIEGEKKDIYHPKYNKELVELLEGTSCRVGRFFNDIYQEVIEEEEV